MTPDDREHDLQMIGGEFGIPLTGRQLPAPTAHVNVRADAFAGRVRELTTTHGMVPDSAIRRTYREFDQLAQEDKTLPPGSKTFLWILLGLASPFLILALGWIVGLLIPLYRDAFSWL